MTQFTNIQDFVAIWNKFNALSDDGYGYGAFGSLPIKSEDVVDNRAVYAIGGCGGAGAMDGLVVLRDGVIYDFFSEGLPPKMWEVYSEDSYSFDKFLKEGVPEEFFAVVSSFSSYEDFFARYVEEMGEDREDVCSVIKSGTLWA